MNKFLFVLLCGCTLTGIQAKAQLRASLKDSLQAVSDEMYAKKNDNFILVDAIKDGILPVGASYSFLYKDGVINFNHKPLTEPLQQRYKQRFEAILPSTQGVSFSESGDTLKLDQIFDTTSSFRKNSQSISLNNDKRDTIIVSHMQRDGLIDTMQKLDILYTQEQITVNGKKLKGGTYASYQKLFNEVYASSQYVRIIHSGHTDKADKPKKGSAR
jgi:hypothetical protein